ncbi:site-specific integrase [Bacillus massilinigeriensis]|uniref:site-specific integrase n=1 Tax=Bacillus massilionigeriensis TaxID=1805475 RepID=UPI00096B1888|nr:site-specific integrase [Bacillus massilionigeriensis]
MKESKEIINKIQEAWQKVLHENLSPSLSEFANLAGISANTLRKYSEWNQKVKERYKQNGVRYRQDKERTLKKIQEAWKRILVEDLYPSVSDFSLLSGVPNRTIRRYPEWYEKIQNRYKEKGTNKLIDRTLTRIQEAWEMIVEQDLYPNLTDFSELFGISRTAIRKHPEWQQKILNRHEDKGINKKVKRTEEKIKKAWDKIIAEDLYPYLKEFCDIAGVSRSALTKHPEWQRKVINRYEEKGIGRRKVTSIGKIQETWEKIIEEDIFPTLTEFAEISGVSRTQISRYPEWKQKIINRYENERKIDRILEKIEQTWNRILKEELYPDLSEFCDMSGVSEEEITRKYGTWETKIKKHYKEMSILRKIEATWEKVIEEKLNPSVMQFGIMAGISGDSIRYYYPEWADKITFRYKDGDLRDVLTRIKDTWEEIVSGGLYPSLSEFSTMANVDVTTIQRSYREWADKILQRNESVFVSANERLESAWNEIIEKDLYPTMTEFAEMSGLSKSHMYVYYKEWVFKVNERLELLKPDKTFMRRNTSDSILYILTNGDWQITYTRHEKDYSVNLSWEYIPDEWLEFWQTVAKTIFDKDKILETGAIIRNAKRFHEWLSFPVFDLETGEILGENRSIDSFDELTESDFGQFEEALKVISFADLPIVETETARREILTDLADGFLVAARELERPEVTMKTVERIREFKNGAYKNMMRKAFERNAKKVLSIKDLEEVLEALAREYVDCEQVGDALKRTLYKKPSGVADMLAVIYIRLGIRHGIRPEEILALKVDDIIEDKENGHHTIHCIDVGNKPERYVAIDKSTLDAIKYYLQWSEPARKELDTKLFAVCYIRVNSGKYIARAATANDLQNATYYFKKRHGLRDELKLNGKNLRRTFGSILAMSTDNREVVRQALGHTRVETTERHYTALNRINLSYQVSKALRVYALELAFAYRNIVYDIADELPEVQKALEVNPERDLKEGVCNVPKKTETLADSCVRAPSCLECNFLIVEARKLPFYYAEKEKYMKKYEEAKSERVKQSRLRRVQQLEAYIFRIEDAIDKKKERELKEDGNGSDEKRPRRRTAYKKKAR